MSGGIEKEVEKCEVCFKKSLLHIEIRQSDRQPWPGPADLFTFAFFQKCCE